MDPITLLSSRPAQCILLQRGKHLKTPFPTLPPDVYPVFPDRSTLKLPKATISRLQLPITLGFALTEYKVQGATFDTAVVDLKRQSKGSRVSTHKRFCSTYVQLSQLRSFAGLGLLQPIDITDVDNHPHPLLCDEDRRLDNRKLITSRAWKEELEARRFR